MISGVIRQRTGSIATGLQNLACRCNDGAGAALIMLVVATIVMMVVLLRNGVTTTATAA